MTHDGLSSVRSPRVAARLDCAYDPSMPTAEHMKSGRDRPSVDSGRSWSRIERSLFGALAPWSAGQPGSIANRADGVSLAPNVHLRRRSAERRPTLGRPMRCALTFLLLPAVTPTLTSSGVGAGSLVAQCINAFAVHTVVLICARCSLPISIFEWRRPYGYPSTGDVASARQTAKLPGEMAGDSLFGPVFSAVGPSPSTSSNRISCFARDAVIDPLIEASAAAQAIGAISAVPVYLRENGRAPFNDLRVPAAIAARAAMLVPRQVHPRPSVSTSHCADAGFARLAVPLRAGDRSLSSDVGGARRHAHRRSMAA